MLSGIKHCDTKPGDSIFSTVKPLKTACMGDNSVIQTTIKTHIVCHRVRDEIIRALSLFFVQYATKSWGGAWERGQYSIALILFKEQTLLFSGQLTLIAFPSRQ